MSEPPSPGVTLATRSTIARPTETGFTGIYVHWDGYPSNHLPLLLAAHQHRFAGDTDALAAHLIDSPAVGWNSLGEDLLDGAPDEVRQHVVGPHGGPGPSSTIDNMFTLDGSPAERMTCNEAAAGQGWLQWAYVLHPHGIEVLPLSETVTGSVVAWDQDPMTVFPDDVRAWLPGRRTPPATTVRKPAPVSTAPVKSVRR